MTLADELLRTVKMRAKPRTTPRTTREYVQERLAEIQRSRRKVHSQDCY